MADLLAALALGGASSAPAVAAQAAQPTAAMKTSSNNAFDGTALHGDMVYSTDRNKHGRQTPEVSGGAFAWAAPRDGFAGSSSG